MDQREFAARAVLSVLRAIDAFMEDHDRAATKMFVMKLIQSYEKAEHDVRRH